MFFCFLIRCDFICAFVFLKKAGNQILLISTIFPETRESGLWRKCYLVEPGSTQVLAPFVRGNHDVKQNQKHKYCI